MTNTEFLAILLNGIIAELNRAIAEQNNLEAKIDFYVNMYGEIVYKDLINKTLQDIEALKNKIKIILNINSQLQAFKVLKDNIKVLGNEKLDYYQLTLDSKKMTGLNADTILISKNDYGILMNALKEEE